MTRRRISPDSNAGANPRDNTADSRQTAGLFNSSLDLAQAVAVLAEAGFSVAGRCVDCGAAIVSPVSIARMRGPRCAAKAAAEAVVR